MDDTGGRIRTEARLRWLKPKQVVDILRLYESYKFEMNKHPPDKPPSGSLFLFDRKEVRFFRKDNHNWRKKKDSKTVCEAHEKLRVESEAVLHCYYAHSEDDHNFQRRCYWLLDKKLEHIVLVHYLRAEKGGGRMLKSFLPANPSPSMEYKVPDLNIQALEADYGSPSAPDSKAQPSTANFDSSITQNSMDENDDKEQSRKRRRSCADEEEEKSVGKRQQQVVSKADNHSSITVIEPLKSNTALPAPPKPDTPELGDGKPLKSAVSPWKVGVSKPRKGNIDAVRLDALMGWLPNEQVSDLLSNYKQYGFELSSTTPYQPPSGSLFFYNRKNYRYFRNDHHVWKRKKSSSSISESHENLKVNDKLLLHCCYTRSEEDRNFQRRCYWLLDKDLEHIVLVHYFQVRKDLVPS